MNISREEKWILDEKYHGEKTEGFFADCARLAAHEPLAYIIGHIPFGSVQIYLDARPLIPRAETEYWVTQCLQSYTASNAPLRILDLCAGSGCIGVLIAHTLPHASVDFVEIDTALHPTITKNCDMNGIEPDRYTILGGDLFQNVTAQYDLIVSNPPYIDPAINRVTKSVQHFEPHQALYGGVRGISLITTIIATAPRFLTPRGAMWLEHEPEQVEEIHARAQASSLQCVTHTDQYTVERFTHFTLCTEKTRYT